MIYNLGSINLDYFYSVPRLPVAGETLATKEFSMGLGGKGANMSVAVARAGGEVHHIGSVGEDGIWAIDYLKRAGVDVSNIHSLQATTGHAVIFRDDDGENLIVIHQGANSMQDKDRIAAALLNARPGDILLLQNETNLQAFAAELGHGSGMKVAYAAAPFDVNALKEVLPYIQILVLNELEMAQLREQTGNRPEALGVDVVIVTKGSDGCVLYSKELGEKHVPAFPVNPLDTTGAGDTFTGYFLAHLDLGSSIEEAVLGANAAAAVMVTKKGTADAIPFALDVEKFLG
ncbi:ribokinase [Roseovarius rhodophyticola]|uniref:Ribokinase n=1 Tax=Roseovarius rhodophyticola TaxID=3080827 RepID=A0ABZ2TJ41_9RHOB|nr:ribokinase [Roseovarius sp. W115]MDV2930074.1 ribokinase [Roseovarius sp. W115]